MSKKIFGVFDKNDITSITTLINRLEESSFDFLKLEGEDVRVVIGKNGMTDVFEAPSNGNGVSVTNGAVGVQEVVTAPAAVTVEQEPVCEAKPVVKIQEKDGIETIKATTYGLYYAQPEPGAPPYVTLGGEVKKGDTVGLLEIMKVFNAITSDFDGVITEILVENAALVEPGQPLFSVKVK